MPHVSLFAPVVLIIAVTCVVLAPVASAASELSFPVTIDRADVRIDAVGGKTAVAIDGPRYFGLADEGLPGLPYRIVSVVLPQGEAVESFGVEASADVELLPSFDPVMAPPAVANDGSTATPEALASWTADGSTFPSQRARYLGTGYLHGHAIASFLVFPVRSVDGALILNESIDLHVTTVPEVRDDVVVRQRFREGFRERVVSEVASFVENPRAVERYSFNMTRVEAKERGGFQPTSYPSLEGSPVDYLIITADSLVSTYQALADWKTAKGVPTVIRTIEYIEATARHGADFQETVRNFIRDAYQKWGITYVLLGADTDLIPARLGYSTTLGTKDLPADMYYVCLDGDWNKNHDEHFGKSGDFLDDPDLYAEVYVGRLPTSTLESAATMIDKIINYETPVDPSYMNKVLLLGEVLFPLNWKPGDTIQQDGADFQEFVYALALTDPSFEVAKLYQNYTEFPGSIEETVQGTLDSLVTGYNIVNHVGHGFRFNMSVGDGSITTQDADELYHPDRFSNYYLLNCTAVAYTFYSLGEHLLLNPDGGAVSVLGANESALPLSSQPYMNEYFHLLFNQDVVNVGEAFSRSRLPRTAIAETSDNVDTWTHYIYTILADPEMALWTGPVEPLIVSHPATTPMGEGTIAVDVSDSQGAVEGALVCLSKGGDDYEVGLTDALGQVSFQFTSESPGSVSVVATAVNRARYQGYVNVTGTTPAYVIYDGLSVDDDSTGSTLGNGDGVIDAGETVELLVSVENTGATATGNVELVLRSKSGNATVEDSTASVGVVGAQSTAPALDAFRVSFSQYIADETAIELQLVVKNDGVETWTDTFYKEVHAPALELVVLRIDDTAAGNGDGIVQDNETFDLFYEVKNFGSGAAIGISATLSDISGGFVFTDSVDTYPDCPANDSVENIDGFTIREPDASTPHNLRIDVTDGYGRTFFHVFELRPPDAPTTMTFDPSLGPDRLKLVWDASASADVEHYRVYRAETSGGPFELASIDPVDHTVFVDRHLQSTTAYYYFVTAVDVSGNESGPSPEFNGSTNPAQVPGWPIGMLAATTSSPVVGDIDGDQDFELVTGNEKVYAWHHDGVELIDYDNNAQTWGLLTTAGNEFVSHIALSDVDAVPGLDIIAASRDTREVYVFDYQGNTVAGWPQPVESPIRAGLVAADLNGDDVNEIIAVDELGVVYVWNTDGTEWMDGDSNPGTHGVFKRTTGNTYLYTTPAVADLDMDGFGEIILGTQGLMVYVWNGDGSDVPGWPQVFGTPISGAIAVGDIDNDGGGDLEIVVCEQGGMNTALHHDGTYLWQVWLPNNQSFGPSPALGDITGNGNLETVIASSNRNLYLIKSNGGGVPGWPVQYATQLFTESSPLVVDLNHDGNLDVLLGDETRFINAWDKNGNLLEGFPIATDDAVRSTPTVADLDKDGDLDLIAVTWNKNTFVWDFPAMFDPHKSPWASYHANLYNDGNITTPLPTGILDATFAFEIVGEAVDLSWFLPPEAGYLFDIYRAPATRTEVTGPFELVAPAIGTDADGRVRYLDRSVEAGARYIYRIDASGTDDNFQSSSIYVPVRRAGMSQNYPNPFNPLTRITFWVPEGGSQPVNLTIYDVRGARVRTLVAGRVGTGRHEVTWDGRNDHGQPVGSGVYFYRMVQRDYQSTRKMLLIK